MSTVPALTNIAGEISAAPHNTNYTALRTGVNNVAAEQITDATITNTEISASAEIAMSKITATASDAALVDVMENYITDCHIFRSSDTLVGVTAGSIMINGELRRNTAAVTDAYPTMTDGHWVAVWVGADTAASTFTVDTVDTNSATPTSGSNPFTNGRFIGCIRFVNATIDIAPWIQYRDGYIYGWDYIVGEDDSDLQLDLTFGVTFDNADSIIASASYHSRRGTATSPTSLSVFNETTSGGFRDQVRTSAITTTTMTIYVIGSSNYVSSANHAFYWKVEGSYS